VVVRESGEGRAGRRLFLYATLYAVSTLNIHTNLSALMYAQAEVAIKVWGILLWDIP